MWVLCSNSDFSLGYTRLCLDQRTRRGVCFSLQIKTAPYESSCYLELSALQEATDSLKAVTDTQTECNPPYHQPCCWLDHHCTSVWKEACLNTPPATTGQGIVQGYSDCQPQSWCCHQRLQVDGACCPGFDDPGSAGPSRVGQWVRSAL